MSKMPYKIIKRVSDIILSLFLLILFSPFLLLVSFLIWLGDRSEICVRDPLRIGLGGKEFRMYKFRTMIPNAHREILENPEYADLKKKWEVNGNKLKIEEDIRITNIGKFLRKTDLDELPQLVNVLMGHMSIVGPRPMYKDELERHLETNPKDEKYLKNILNVRPGITGLWQVSGRNEIPFGKRLKMDAKYAQEQGFLLDMRILLKTPYVVLTRKGAYE
ncbi:MAG: sugar transferase [Candidatus Dojkabacteria bacterium]